MKIRLTAATADENLKNKIAQNHFCISNCTKANKELLNNLQISFDNYFTCFDNYFPAFDNL